MEKELVLTDTVLGTYLKDYYDYLHWYLYDSKLLKLQNDNIFE